MDGIGFSPNLKNANTASTIGIMDAWLAKKIVRLKMLDTKKYWACAPPDEICDELRKKIDAYYDWMRSSGRLALWARIHRQYYSGLFDGASLSTDGKQDEQIRININNFRNLVQHLKVMTSSTRPKFDPRAVNSDHKSQTQTILAAGILDYVLKEKNLEPCALEALEIALLFADAFLAVDWDATKGAKVGVHPDGQSFIRSGEIVFRVYSPMDMVRDWTKSREEEHQWFCARRWVNRYDLMSRYPEYADAISNLPTKLDTIKRPKFVNMAASGSLYRYETEDVDVYDFIHDRTDALPEGRKVTMLIDAGDTPPLYDGPLPFDDLSLYRLTPALMLGTAGGYSPAYDLLSLQEAENNVWTTVISNFAAFGIQNIWVKEGDNVDVATISGGLKIVQSREPPQPLQLVANSKDSYEIMDRLTNSSETISGINSVARGNPEASLKSGAALALVQAQALQFSIGLQQAWTRFFEQVASGVIKCFRRFAKSPQTALIVGKSNKGHLQEFTADDLDQIDRVAVDLGNPLSRSIAGRLQLLDFLGQRNLIRTAQEAIQVITTGALEPALEADQKEMLAIKSENERLSEGAPAGPEQQPTMNPMSPMGSPQMMQAPAAPRVTAMLTDNHPAHIREHAAVIADPESRETPSVVEATLAHIQEHIDLWMAMPPALGAALNIPPPPMPMMPPGQGGAPQVVPQGPGQQVPPPAQEPAPTDPTAPDGMPSMPNMPKDALTGERAPESPPVGMQ
jgi:hypothetical protein